MTRYLLDSNIFIQSFNLSYRPSFCSAFWDLLRTLHLAGRVFSISSVKKELVYKDDDLANLVLTLPDTFFLNEKIIGQPNYTSLMNWAMVNPQFTDGAKIKFASDHADPWLVAYAAQENMIIVTQESYNQNIKTSIKIPNAAEQLDVKWIGLFDFLDSVCENNFQMKP